MTQEPQQPSLVEELLRTARAEVARAYTANLLADALEQFVFPAAAALADINQQLSRNDPPVPSERIAVLTLNPSLPDLLGQLQELLADIQDGWAAWQLLGSWQPVGQGPTAVSRIRRNAPADAWQEETVEQSIEKAEARIAAVKARVSQYVGLLVAQSRAYLERARWDFVVTNNSVHAAMLNAARHTDGLANLLKQYARLWGVPID